MLDGPAEFTAHTTRTRPFSSGQPAREQGTARDKAHDSSPPRKPPDTGGGRNCDPNYSGCLNPNASDYDCRGGSGDGALYTGPVTVKGDDHYGLDADGDGVGCDS